MTSKRQRGAALIEVKQTPEDQAASAAQQSPEIPSHVWSILQEAGELAAVKLRDLLASPRFSAYTPSAQKALIELAMTRAYGLPVKRSLSVNLASDDADAIAASLMSLSDRLPEAQRGPLNGHPDISGDDLPDED